MAEHKPLPEFEETNEDFIHGPLGVPHIEHEPVVPPAEEAIGELASKLLVANIQVSVRNGSPSMRGRRRRRITALDLMSPKAAKEFEEAERAAWMAAKARRRPRRNRPPTRFA